MTHKIDMIVLSYLSKAHHFLSQQGFYPVFLSTLLCFGLFAGRVYISRTWIFYFLLWNLFLAWIPYLGSLWAVYLHRTYPGRWWLLLFPGILSVAFFPNAPYIVTDFLHLADRPPVPFWYDIGMLTSFAWTGVILAIYALRILQTILKSLVGTLLSWVFAVGVLGLSGMGIYMGRFLRWNSWDLLIQPKAILYDVAGRLRDPLGNPRTFGVTLLYAALMLVCYLALTAGPSAPKERETPAVQPLIAAIPQEEQALGETETA